MHVYCNAIDIKLILIWSDLVACSTFLAVSLRCSLLDVSECLAVGHSPAVRLAPFEEGDTGALPTLNQTALYAGLWRAFGLAECPWQVDTLRRFACAASLPACNRDSSVRLPCGSLCKRQCNSVHTTTTHFLKLIAR